MEKCVGKNIAVMLFGPLGDVINSSVVFRLLKKNYPDAEMSLLTTNRGMPATVGIPEIQNVYVLDKSKKGYRKNLDAFKFALSLRGKFDTVIVLDNSLRSAICAFLTFAKRRIGRGRELRELFLTDIVPYLEEERRGQIHVSEHYARCLKPLGIYEENQDTHFDFTDEDAKFAENMLCGDNPENKKIVGFCPACRLERKNIEIDNCAEIIRQINARGDYKVAIFGGSDVADYAQELKKYKDIDFLDYTGKTTFAQTAALIDRCDKFISVDTACMHLAFARKVPTLAIFYSPLYIKWGPKNTEINKTYVNLTDKSISTDTFLQDFYSLPDKSKPARITV